MNLPIALSAAIAAVAFGVHAILGGAQINAPIQASTLDPFVRGAAAVAWHGVSVVLAVVALGLGWLAWHRNPALAVALSVVQLGFAALFVGFGLAMMGSLWFMPQWTVFLLMPALTAWGARAWRAVA